MQNNEENVNQRDEQDVSVQYDFSIKFSNNSKSQNLLVNKTLHSEDETIKSERDSHLLNGSKKSGNYCAVRAGETLQTTPPSNCYDEEFIDPVVNQDNKCFEPVKGQDKLEDGRNVNPTGKEIQNIIIETSLISSNPEDEGLENKNGSCDDQSDIESTDLSTPTFSFRALGSRHKLILISISLCSFLSYLCLSLIAPFFPSEAASKNVSDSVSGWIFGIFALTQFLISPVSGKLLPLMGLKFMYIGGLFIAAGCTVLFGTLTYIDTSSENITFIIYCFLLRIILAIGCCGLQTASFALVAKEFPDSVATVFSGGFIMPFSVVGAIMFLCVPFNFWLIPADTVVEKSSSSKISFWVMMKSPKTIINSFSTLVAAMIYSILDPTLEPHLSGSFNLEADIIGLLFLLMAAFYAIMSPIAGWICDKLIYQMSKMDEEMSRKIYQYLCNIIGTEEVVKTRRKIFCALDSVIQITNISVLSSGSKAESLDLKGSDYDHMHVYEMFQVYENKRKVSFFANKIPIVMDISDIKPGFTKLKLYNQRHVYESGISQWVEIVEGETYLSSKLFREDGLLDNMIIHGPCQSVRNETYDCAFCLRCKEWITPARQWVFRSRSAWPDDR